MKTNHSTRISPHMARLWQMLNILFTIRSFEQKIAINEEKIRKCEKGLGSLLPTYAEPLRNEYLGAIESFKQRIADEEAAYNQLLNEMALLSIAEDAKPLQLPRQEIFESDEQNTYKR